MRELTEDGFVPGATYGRGPYAVTFDDGVVVRFPTMEAASGYRHACEVMLKAEETSRRQSRKQAPKTKMEAKETQT